MHHVNWYYESVNPTVQFCNGFYALYSCSIGKGTAVDYGNDKWDFTLTVTWNGENITSGVLNHSNSNGDHVYRFYLYMGDVMRNCSHTITGESL